jgi:biotin-[acetyl-CoA-carboxylase] ligase BirA-like protein
VTFTHLHQPSVPSTNVWALSWLKEHGLNSPTLFTADGQTAGQGQREKSWSTHHGEDVSLSLALPVQSGWSPPVFNMAVALSIRASLARLCPPHAAHTRVQVKWPNDILISQEGSDLKCAGILVENVWRGASWSATVVGVGVNVNSDRLTSPFHATSLRDAWGVELRPAEVSHLLAQELLEQLTHPMNPEAIARGFRGHLFGLGQLRSFDLGGQTRQGVLSEVDNQGRAKFTWADSGEEQWLQSGDVGWRFEDAVQNRD